MRKTIIAMSAIAAITLTSAASAQERYRDQGNAAKLGAGAVAGTVVGLGLYNGWFGSGTFASSLPSSAAGAAATGLVVGIGTGALIDAATQPCKGFRALFSSFYPGPSGCVNGEFVGYRYSERQPARRG